MTFDQRFACCTGPHPGTSTHAWASGRAASSARWRRATRLSSRRSAPAARPCVGGEGLVEGDPRVPGGGGGGGDGRMSPRCGSSWTTPRTARPRSCSPPGTPRSRPRHWGASGPGHRAQCHRVQRDRGAAMVTVCPAGPRSAGHTAFPASVSGARVPAGRDARTSSGMSTRRRTWTRCAPPTRHCSTTGSKGCRAAAETRVRGTPGRGAPAHHGITSP
jgi:hypothetical protein